MTKITQRYDVFRRYMEDFWGFFHIKKNKSLSYWRLEDFRRSYLRPPITPFLDLNAVIPKRKRRRIRTFYGRLHNVTFQLRRYFINLTKRHLFFLFKKSRKIGGSLKKNFSLSLESRVDAILLRINLFTSVKLLRQWIIHGFILKNLKPVKTSNQYFNLGDVLSFSIREKLFLKNYFFQRYFFPRQFWSKQTKYNIKKSGVFFYYYKHSTKIPFFLPKYLDLNYRLFFFTLWRAPLWKEIPFLKKIKSNQIVAFPYSKT